MERIPSLSCSFQVWIGKNSESRTLSTTIDDVLYSSGQRSGSEIIKQIGCSRMEHTSPWIKVRS